METILVGVISLFEVNIINMYSNSME